MSSAPPSSAAADTFASLIGSFTDFLTAAIHTILYERGIYPRTSFLSAKKYNFAVRQSRHPGVCAWIADAVRAVEAELLKGSASRIALVIFSPRSRPLERFVFDVSRFPAVPRAELHTPIERPPPKRPDVDLEEQFRAAMARLSGCGAALAPLPSDCSFTIALELRDAADPPIAHPQPWIPAEPSAQRCVVEKDGVRAEVRRGPKLGGARTTPVRAVETRELAFEVWIEEGTEKVRSAGADSQGSRTTPTSMRSSDVG